MNVLRELLLSMIGSGLVLGLFLFIAKKYFDKLISTEFEKRLKLSEFKIGQAAKVSDFLLSKQEGIYPEILEITYRLKNILGDGIKESHAYKWNSDIKPLCCHLIENLFKYRLFLSEEIFDALHEFKHIVQDALIFYDVHTREEKLFDKDAYQKELSKIAAKYERTQELYSFIEKEIRKKFDKIIKV